MPLRASCLVGTVPANKALKEVSCKVLILKLIFKNYHFRGLGTGWRESFKKYKKTLVELFGLQRPFLRDLLWAFGRPPGTLRPLTSSCWESRSPDVAFQLGYGRSQAHLFSRCPSKNSTLLMAVDEVSGFLRGCYAGKW